ncbi:MAG: hypothetical protein LIP09_04450 [Bacteroidales bacterium]|nr:hypothetical protein [Bacteroidales bacterium]
MNKIAKIFLSLAAVALPMCFASCSSDDDTPATGDQVNVAAKVIGTYSGTYSVEDVTNETTTDYTGTLVFTAYTDDAPYAAYMTINCDCETPAFAGTAAANLVPKSRAYGFYNELSSNPLGFTFQGEIDFDGNTTMSFSMAVKQGKKTYVYNVNFSGSKQ